ncbi:MAG: hypothetical protein AB7S74_03310 [Hyphomicrobium sp.]
MSKPPLKAVAPSDAGRSWFADLAASCLALLLCTSATQAAPRHGSEAKDAWTSKTQVHEQPASCEGLKKAMDNRVAELGKLQEAIKKDQNGPPHSLLGVFKNMTGQSYTSEVLKNKQELLDRARRRAETLNDLLDSQGCGAVDIDDALKILASKRSPRDEE